MERQCFGRGQTTRLMLLSRAQRDGYCDAYGTEPERITLLPPTVAAGRRQPELRHDGTREKMRASLGIAPGDWLWLAVGSAPKTKGFDRVVEALPGFPAARLLIVGVDAGNGGGAALVQQAARRRCRERMQLIGFHENVPELMAAADVLVHPARLDTTGTVILEAIVNGLPAIASAACGYAEHISAADAGIVLSEPYHAAEFLAALAAASEAASAQHWSVNAIRYGQNPDLFRGLDVAADIIVADAAHVAAPLASQI